MTTPQPDFFDTLQGINGAPKTNREILKELTESLHNSTLNAAGRSIIDTAIEKFKQRVQNEDYDRAMKGFAR